ncbi:MAG: hypothetical protein NZ941_01705 [Candidatus Caldarchaeum sp.]|nr:hypothetical protein [Candidatus Caldarchaeum sp.]MDW7978803.1 hypothetical protein [Candidatus Caldarchaeum sp.]
MSEAFVKAYKHVEEQLSKNTPEAMIQEKMPEFRDGVFVVNKYVPSDPPMLGMGLKNPVLQLTKDLVLNVEKFAKRRGLLVRVEGDNIYLSTKEGVKKAWLRPDFFAATNPQLFESIGKVFYNLSPDLLAQLEFSEGLTATVARLLADKTMLTKGIVALFFLFSPALWVAISMFLTESLFYPRWSMIVAGAVALAAAAYLIRLYLNENFPELSMKTDTSRLKRKSLPVQQT